MVKTLIAAALGAAVLSCGSAFAVSSIDEALRERARPAGTTEISAVPPATMLGAFEGKQRLIYDPSEPATIDATFTASKDGFGKPNDLSEPAVIGATYTAQRSHPANGQRTAWPTPVFSFTAAFR